jgi:hypothetical protein
VHAVCVLVTTVLSAQSLLVPTSEMASNSKMPGHLLAGKHLPVDLSPHPRKQAGEGKDPGEGQVQACWVPRNLLNVPKRCDLTACWWDKWEAGRELDLLRFNPQKGFRNSGQGEVGESVASSHLLGKDPVFEFSTSINCKILLLSNNWRKSPLK